MPHLNPQQTHRHQLRTAKEQRNHDAALAAFLGTKAKIDEMLARLAHLRDNLARITKQARRISALMVAVRGSLQVSSDATSAKAKTQGWVCPATEILEPPAPKPQLKICGSAVLRTTAMVTLATT